MGKAKVAPSWASGGNVNGSFIAGAAIPAKNRLPGYRHVIEDVKFRPGILPKDEGDAPIWCVCGWEGKVKEWAEHRTSSGSRKPSHFKPKEDSDG